MADSTRPAATAVADPLPLKLIGSVSVSPSTARPGQSVLVEVLDGSGKPYPAGSPVAVTINGVPAARRYMQFVGAGLRTLQIRAVMGKTSDTATATVTVAGTPLTFRRTLTPPEVTPLAKLVLEQSFSNHYVASFTLGTAVPAPKAAAPAPSNAAALAPSNAAPASGQKPPAAALPMSDLDRALAALPVAELVPAVTQQRTDAAGGKLSASFTVAKPSAGIPVAPQKTSYKWDFGDGKTATTQTPAVTHDYFHAIQAGLVSHAFDVTCTVEHDDLSVTRTFVLNSAYALCKRFGTIVPNVESDTFASWHKNVGFSASMTVYNIEAAPIKLTAMGFVALGDDPDATLADPVFTAMASPLTIEPHSASALAVLVPVAQLGAVTKLGSACRGFMIYYRGTCTVQNETTPVLFSRTVRIPLTQSGGAWLAQAGASTKQADIDWQAVGRAAFAVAGDAKLKIAADPSAVTADGATRTFALALAAPPYDVASQAQARAAVRSGIAAAVTATGEGA